MNLQEIEKLIRKYEQGDTSLEEENLLKDYFEKKQVPEHLSIYKEVFGFYETASYEELPDPGFNKKFFEKIGIDPERTNKSGVYRKFYPHFAVAASIVILLGLFFLMKNQPVDTGTYDDPEIAYAETKRILMQVSGTMNTGMDDLSNMKKLSSGMNELQKIQSFNEGMQTLEKISILDKSTQMVIQ